MRLAWLGVLLLACGVLPARAQPVTDHPRLWLRPADLPRLRSWATPANPVFELGLKALATDFKSRMDNGSLVASDPGCSRCYVQRPLEWAAELFAFMSLVENDPSLRADYQQRARTLLMYVIDRAVLGEGPPGTAFRERGFSTTDRSLFYGEAFPLTVDWIYPALSSADKAKIRTTFLRWIGENLTATTSGMDHPEPVWVLNSPALYADRKRARNAINNFYNAHMNQIGLMALALDPADDVGPADAWGKGVRDYVSNAIGAWLYVHHYMASTDQAGGVPPEGMAYGPTGLGRATELLLALQTAGYGDASVWGPQVRMDTPFWDQVIDAYLHASSPTKVINHPDEAYRGTVHLISDHGDTYKEYLQGQTTLLATIGLQAQLSGNTARLEAVRWMELNMPAGGAATLVERAGDWNFVRDCVLTFLLFDPTAAPAPDPRPARPTFFFAPGTRKVLARTDWGPNASWFTYHLGWTGIDHQFGDANSFEFWRKGEWLTKQWAGYGMIVAGSDYKNTLVLENTPPATGIDFWLANYRHGSQYLYGPGGDPPPPAISQGPDHVYALGNARNAYNNPPAQSTDILDATRSIIWLKPDTIVVYDRAESQTAGRTKRFTLMLPAAPSINGRRVTAIAGSGSTQQQLVIDSLLPAQVEIGVDSQIPNENGYNETAEYERMTRRLKIDATGGPARARFLHVLQGLDAGAAAPVPLLLESSAGTPVQGVEIGNAAVLFPVDVAPAVATTTFSVSAAVARIFLTGLVPGTRYAVGSTPSGNARTVVVTASPAGSFLADSGGVVVVGGSSTVPVLGLTTALNASSFRPGDAVVLTATLTPGPSPQPVDAYIVVRLPSGSYLSWTGASLVPGLVPIVRSLRPVDYQGVVARVTVPVGTPPGSYAWLSAVTSPGTLNLLSAIAETPFTIVP